MNDTQLFEHLKQQPTSAILELLQRAFRELSIEQRHRVFDPILRDAQALPVNSEDLLKRVKTFFADSLAGQYYAPFEINWKNCPHIPEKTKDWFETLGDLMEESSKLIEQADHSVAVVCFEMLYKLIERMEHGDEIVFADEYGSWMIPGDTKKFTAAYLSSLSTIVSPEVYTNTAIDLIRRDGRQSFSDKVYESAIRAANKDQRAHLKAEIMRQNIRTI